MPSLRNRLASAYAGGTVQGCRETEGRIEAAVRKEAQLPGDSAAYEQVLEGMNKLQTEEPMAR